MIIPLNADTQDAIAAETDLFEKNAEAIEARLLFEQILKEQKVTAFFQPIVDLKSGEILGYEALSRGPEHTMFYSPLALIEMARQTERIWELELLFRQKALERIGEIDHNKLLFLNVDPEVIKAPDYKTGLTKARLESLNFDESRIVFEITERTAIVDYDAFHAILKHYRDQGYLIAIDDVGAGYSGLKTINEIRPNFIKIDMDLIRNIDKDAFKQALIKAFVDTSVTTNIRIIAEGIETKEELKTLILLGVHAGQGFYIQQPSRTFRDLDESLLKRIGEYNKISGNLNGYAQEYHYISNLIFSHENRTYESMTHCATVKSQMDKLGLQSVCICDNDRPVGIVMKHRLDASLSGKYGFSLYANRPIGKVMNGKPLIVDYYTPISVVAKSAMERPDDEIFDDVIVTKGNHYHGMVSMKRIFEYTLMFEKNNAKEHNPLTGLPGNPIINRVLSDAIAYNQQSCIFYIDINDFKVYNDVYGFERGDMMICSLAGLLQQTVKKQFPYASFIGHVGGDDFVVVLSGETQDYHDMAENILLEFESNKNSFFSEAHLGQNKIVSEDRFGIVREFPLTSLSIAGIYGDLSVYAHSEQMSESLAKIKKAVKKRGKSSYFLVNSKE